ncbi:MAG: hypothetical protein IJQ81_05590 [Oscillibacter sp.]|nr:hypothetical protein [Oscillibacter sp.]
MSRFAEEIRAETRKETLKEARSQMVYLLLLSNSEEDLLYDSRFKALDITPEEIEAAKERKDT